MQPLLEIGTPSRLPFLLAKGGCKSSSDSEGREIDSASQWEELESHFARDPDMKKGRIGTMFVINQLQKGNERDLVELKCYAF